MWSWIRSHPVASATGGLIAYTVGTYAGVSIYNYYQNKSKYEALVQQAKTNNTLTQQQRHKVFQDIAETYDEKVAWDELITGIKLLRWFLLSNAKGKVLEVAAGTGRNLPYYIEEKCEAVVLTDSNDSMLKRLKEKAHGMWLPLTIVKMDASELPFKDAVFDTVIDTFGICSFEDPGQALKEMRRVCKPDGAILLLEHGESNWQFMKDALKFGALDHLEKWGCYWNRDILKLIEDSGMEIVSCWRIHFGTTYMIVARPSKSVHSEANE